MGSSDFTAWLRTWGSEYTIVPIPPDGNCLFHAWAVILHTTAPVLRSFVLKYLQQTSEGQQVLQSWHALARDAWLAQDRDLFDEYRFMLTTVSATWPWSDTTLLPQLMTLMQDPHYFWGEEYSLKVLSRAFSHTLFIVIELYNQDVHLVWPHKSDLPHSPKQVCLAWLHQKHYQLISWRRTLLWPVAATPEPLASWVTFAWRTQQYAWQTFVAHLRQP